MRSAVVDRLPAYNSAMITIAPRSSITAKAGGATDSGSLFAHMLAVVASVFVGGGAELTEGRPLLAVEAMKVEHTIRAVRRNGNVHYYRCERSCERSR